MLVTGLSLDKFKEITDRVSADKYDGNVVVHHDAHPLSGNRFQGRLWVQSSRGPGARRSWSGRRMPAACWHAYRDVLMAVFSEYPDAIARTGLATYRGLEGFLRDYPATGERNVGSVMQPVTMPELCDHEGNDPEIGYHRRMAYLNMLNQQARTFNLSNDAMTPDTSQPYVLDAIDDVIQAAERLRELAV